MPGSVSSARHGTCAVTPSGHNATALPLTTDDDLQLRDGAGRLVASSASWEASTEQFIAVS